MLFTYQTITKGTPATITLSKPTLFSLLSDNYFKFEVNVKSLIAIYESDTGGQKEILTFDLSKEQPTATFLLSDRARGTFLLQKLILNDFDNGALVIPRNELPESVISQNGTIVSGLVTSYSFKVESYIIQNLNTDIAAMGLGSPIAKIILTTSDGDAPKANYVYQGGQTINTIFEKSYLLRQDGTKDYLTEFLLYDGGLRLVGSTVRLVGENNLIIFRFGSIFFQLLYSNIYYIRGGAYFYSPERPMILASLTTDI